MTVSVDMDKQQVTRQLGKPSVLRGSIKNKFGQVVEVWEYRVDQGKSRSQFAVELGATLCTFGLLSPVLLKEGKVDTYWLYFCDNSLVRWGQAGDWEREASAIYEFNFNPTPKLAT